MQSLDFEGGPLPALRSAQACLTPHLCAPLCDDAHPNEITIRRAGVYNLGFVGMRLDESTRTFLDWWADRLWRHGHLDPGNGLFVDQSWMDYAPCFLEKVDVLRSPALNVAYWNLGQRHLEQQDGDWQVAGEPVRFVHFSGLDLGDLDCVSRHQDRLRLSERPELLPLFEHYRELVLGRGHEQLRSRAYSYGFFRPEGPTIPDVARRQLARVDPLARRWESPFETSSEDSFWTWLTEPHAVAQDGASINRMALAIWEESYGAGVRFADVLGADLPTYQSWLRDGGGAASFGVDPSFFGGLTQAMKAPEWPVELEPARLPSGQQAQSLLERYDLTEPGELTEWLNTPVVCAREAPTLTRLAVLVHSAREDLRQRFPDPLGTDQKRFAKWFVKRARDDYQLSGDLVEPIKRTLGWLR